MALTASIPSEDENGVPIGDWRLIQATQVARDANGDPRLGVLDPDPSTPIVTGTTSMAYLVKAAVGFVSQRTDDGGVELSANDAVTSVATTAAPGSNSRIDVIWQKCQFDVYGDSSLYVPTFGVTQGTAASIPEEPSIPDGATKIATAVVTSSDVTTETVVVTDEIPYTAMAGGVVPFRNAAEMVAWVPAAGAVGYRLDLGLMVIRGLTDWESVPHSKTIRRVFSATNTFSDQTSYGDFPVSVDATALAMTFPKATSGSKLRIEVAGTAQLTSGVAQKATVGVRIGSTDYDVAVRAFPVATNRQDFAGFVEVTGVAAGSLSIKPRFKSGTASSFQFFTDDMLSYTVTETS